MRIKRDFYPLFNVQQRVFIEFMYVVHNVSDQLEGGGESGAMRSDTLSLIINNWKIMLLPGEFFVEKFHLYII